MLRKIFIIFAVVLTVYLSLIVFSVDIMGVRQLAARNLVGDISQTLYKSFKSNSKFPERYSMSKEQITKNHVASYSYKLISNDNFELIVNIKNIIIKNDIFMANKDGVFILTGKNEWYQVRRGINMKDEKLIEIKR